MSKKTKKPTKKPKPKIKHSGTIDSLRKAYKYNTKYEAMNLYERLVDTILHTSLSKEQITKLVHKDSI